MVEMTLIWNHVTQVLGPNGQITYPAQLLPMMIGALSFLRICWLLFQRWQNPPEECGEEDEATPRAPPNTSQAGLGLLPSPSAYSEAKSGVIGQDNDTSIVRNRSVVMRYMVAYLPWLSQFDFWKNPKGHRRLQSSLEEDGNNYHDLLMSAIRTSYKPGEDVDLNVRSMPSSTDTSPMIDMKSPTSTNDSPVMRQKI
jgi:hypothetical protein